MQRVISLGGGGLVTQDKIRPTNSKRQWTDETEGKRMEEWKEVITPDGAKQRLTRSDSHLFPAVAGGQL